MATNDRVKEKRAAIVTGAGNGLGAAFARALADDGTAVLVNNRRHADRPCSAQAVADAIGEAGGQAVADGHAVDPPGAATAIVAACMGAFGRLDALVLNAGISGPAVKLGQGDLTLGEIMAINFDANVGLVEAALPALTGSPAGRIVFISSSAGLHGVRGRAAYAASKGALNAFALSLADELRRTPVRVNVIAPYAATRMTGGAPNAGEPRLHPARVAPVVAWFASAACTRTGEIWVAGADRVRRAAAMEGAGGRFDPAALDRLAATQDARGFTGAEAAFADFHAELEREGPCPG